MLFVVMMANRQFADARKEETIEKEFVAGEAEARRVATSSTSALGNAEDRR